MSRPVGSHNRNIPKHRNFAISERALNGETLQNIANDYGLTRERIRQIVFLHTGRTKRDINEVHMEKIRDMRRKFLCHSAMEIAFQYELTCIVCGAWNIREGKSRYLNGAWRKKDVVPHFLTCSADCTDDFRVIRHRLYRRTYMMHQSNHILSNKERYDTYSVSHAERIRDGENVLHPGRWHTNKGTASYDAVIRVRKLRKALGTEHMFDDEISEMRIRSEDV